MREILFRGKSAEDGKWFTGQLLHFKSPVSEKELNVVVEGCEWDDSNEWFNIGRKANVIPETIGQFTGLTDKNGKNVFDGDIISIPFEEDRHPYEDNVTYYENAEVYFDTERYGWYVRCSDDDSLSIWEYDDCDISVIGNIHDNPELLKGGEV